MTETKAPKCSQRVWRGGGYLGTNCRNSGKFTYNGRLWCRVHYPPNAEKRREEQRAEWDRERMRDERARLAQKLRDEIVGVVRGRSKAGAQVCVICWRELSHKEDCALGKLIALEAKED